MSFDRVISRIIDRRRLSEGAVELVLEKPAAFTHLPGQRIRLTFAGAERDYSLASIASDERLMLCIRVVAGGRVSTALADADAGSPVPFSGPHGYFCYHTTGRRPVCVATGTGIAPFVAMLRSGVDHMTLLHGVRHPRDLYYADLFSDRLKTRYIPCVSGHRADGREYAGRVSRYIADRLPEDEYDFYLCGRQEMVRDVIHLVDRRFPGSRIFTEVFF